MRRVVTLQGRWTCRPFGLMNTPVSTTGPSTCSMLSAGQVGLELLAEM